MRSIKKNIKPLLLIATMLIGAQHNVALAGNAAQDILNNAFGHPDYSSSSAATSYKTQRANVLSGGSYSERNKIVNMQLVGFDPFSISSGCGGIDIYGGSLSFINKEQFVKLLESIMKGAKGYAFNIALETLCPQCMASINNLQSKIQKLTQANINSCEMAQGIVTDAVDSLTNKKFTMKNTEQALLGTSDEDYQSIKTAGKAVYNTFEAAISNWNGSKAAGANAVPGSEAAKNFKKAEKDAMNNAGGALTYKAIYQTNPDTWFNLNKVTIPVYKTTSEGGENVDIEEQELTKSGGDMAELILSYAGSLVLGDPEDGKETKQKKIILEGMTNITLKNMVEGSYETDGKTQLEVDIYDCSKNRAKDNIDVCLIDNTDTKKVKITGYMTLMSRALNVFIDNMEQNNKIKDDKPKKKLKPQIETWLGSLPGNTVGRIQSIMVNSNFTGSEARLYVTQTIKNISYITIKTIMDEIFAKVRISVAQAQIDEPLQKENLEIIERAQKRLENEFNMYWDKNNSDGVQLYLQKLESFNSLN